MLCWVESFVYGKSCCSHCYLLGQRYNVKLFMVLVNSSIEWIIESTSYNRICFYPHFLFACLLHNVLAYLALLFHFVLIKVVLEGKYYNIENSFTDLVSKFIDQRGGSDTSSSSFLWREEDETSEDRVLGLKATGCSPHTYR